MLTPSSHVATKEKFDCAKKLKEEGKFDEAYLLLQQVVETSPNHVPALLQLVTIHENHQEWEQVATYCQKVVEIKPDRIGTYLKLAKAVQKQGDTNGAIAAYKKAIELKSNQPANVYINLGNALSEEDRIDEAVDAYRQALKRKSELPQIHVKLGELLEKRGQFGVAVEYFHQALMLKPEWGAQIQMKLASARAQLGQLDEAVTHYETALRIDPNIAEAYQKLGDIFQQKGSSKEALEYFRKANNLQPDNLKTQQLLKAAMPKPSLELNVVEEFSSTQKAFQESKNSVGKKNFSSGSLFKDSFKKFAPRVKWKHRRMRVDKKQLEGKEEFPTLDIEWNRSSIIAFTLFIGIPYIGSVVAAFVSGVKAFIIATIAGPIVLALLAGLLYFLTRNY
ncbi:tetratricopeptide repeat protein [Oscillatoriales cyanobacterium LEGE 11467]|uniref:Tetratricopeptide repeat protein n=1 Tax=Zarconia navalis LEGE 11467 TaxID=1828826 RepID=A0A928VT15_9CYAN|nr:tetratricopeptide repeat protein [Zarconia navalis]MBE9039621.1 tetratricopeptide repeat protein [Zarconia navalis LEGE 11467]